jgi:hypothetical protein
MELATFVGEWVVWAVVGIGSIWGGLTAIRAIGKHLVAHNYAIELVDIQPHFYHNDKSRPNVITGVHLSAILTNSGRSIGFVGVDRIESSLGGKRAEPEPVAWKTLPMRPGIGVSLAADNINVRIGKGDFVEGRIDWALKIGPREDKLKETFRIKGSIAVNTTRKNPMFVWVPDDDSEHPIGMSAGGAERTPDGVDLRDISARL